ncbi:chitobiase/beta-hexosaminidase C-terminal domain-containing protein [Neolewinella persica]|uniref:chitobiase/beta-hexosaminidase C-terminal domain-containing protein n=1 Tax=Neolewinella persica TaxID=70998 RepID=UPI00036F9E7F|nr:chitobiase/beta-hexosaminidase C-terminal domain-containing protein [Neolewinella persica]
MKTIFSVALFLIVTSCSQPPFLQADAVALSPPVIRVENTFFTETASISVGETQGGSRVRYTVDGTVPTVESPAAEREMSVDKSQVLTFRTLGGGFLPSEPVEVEVLKLPAQRLTLISATPAAPPYNQVPDTVLADRAKAGKNFRETDWLGYQDSLLTFEFSLPGGPINGIAVSVLEDQASWIFAPASLQATFYDEAGKEIASGQVDYPTEVEKSGSHFRFLRVNTEEVNAARVLVEVVCLSRIPDWHPGAGEVGWVFLDEVVLR